MMEAFDITNEESPIAVFFRSMLKYGSYLNITFVTTDENGMGKLIDKQRLQYDGCLGSLQRNESDIAVTFPLDDYYGPVIEPWVPLWADYPIIGSTYNKNNVSRQATRVLDFVGGFGVTSWILSGVATGFMMILLMASWLLRKERKETARQRKACENGNPIRKKKKWFRRMTLIRTCYGNMLTMTISCILKQNGNCVNLKMTTLISMLYTLLTLLCFFASYFLTSMIKTHMVIVKPPMTYNSYQDILDHDAVPGWLAEFDDQRTFRDAETEQRQRKYGIVLSNEDSISQS
jgi:hypothetical protein